MGVDYTATTIIGICCPKEDQIARAKVKVRKKTFDHKFEDNGEIEFNPKDGRKLWLDEYEMVDSDYPSIIIDVDGSYDSSNLPGQIIIKLPKDIMYEYSTDNEDCYIGWKQSANSDSDEVYSDFPNIGKMREKLKKLLNPHKLWCEDSFGIYTVLYCSY